MQFQIPQFIEVEDKVIGPLTIKQFIYLAIAGAISFALFFVFKLWLWLFVTVILGAAAGSMAFIKYNGQPLAKVIVSALSFFWRPHLYLWQREVTEKIVSLPEGISVENERRNLKDFFSEMPSVKKLWQDLATTKTPIPKREKALIPPPEIKYTEKFEVMRKMSGEKQVARRVDYR